MNEALISVVLPTYNEKENILILVSAIHNELVNFNHEIIVVDDNSPDKTYQILVDANLPYLRPVLRTQNRGLAFSIREGIENANGNIIIALDSDFNHNPVYLPFMINALNNYDCVTGTRYVYGGGMHDYKRYIFSKLFNVFVRVFTFSSITDHLSGFFAIKKDILTKIDFNKVFWGYGDYYIRMLYYLQKKKVTILQIPVFYDIRTAGESKTKFLKTFLIYTKATLSLVFSNSNA